MTIYLIPLEKIYANPWQTRAGEPSQDYIKNLALDIAANGLMQTPIGRLIAPEGSPLKDIAYPLVEDGLALVQLAFGHNRLTAYKWLHALRNNSNLEGDWSKMAVDIRGLTNEQMAVMAWSENEKRRDVTAIERARAIQQRLEYFKWTNRQCAEALGIDHSTVSNLLRLLKLPEDLQQAILDGKLSERQALAVLPVFEAPESTGFDGYYATYNGSKQIAAAALDGESSDKLRKKVEDYFTHLSQDLMLAEFKLDQLIPEEGGVYCGLCKTCDRRMASRNRCFMHSCFEAKTAFVRREYLKRASKATGYPLVDEHKGGYTTSLPSGVRQRIIETKCPNLALEYGRGTNDDCVDGFPHARLVCEKRNDSCTCIKGLKMLSSLGSGKQQAKKLVDVFAEDRTGAPFQEGDNDGYDADEAQADVPDDDGAYVSPSGLILTPFAGQAPATLTADELEDAARQARKDKRAITSQMPVVREQLEKHLYQALAVGEATGVLFVVAHGSVWPYGRDLEREQLYRYMARKAAGTLMPSTADSLADLLKSINHHLGTLNLEQLVLEEVEV